MITPTNLPDVDPPRTSDEKVAAPDQPQQIGRYRIEKILGEGGFGRVYLAHDDQLNRRVAIKVPRRERLLKPKDAEAYLTEARTVASLDHPNIVPVFDVGSTEDGLCFVVSKFIEGSDLAKRIQGAAISHAEATGWIATVSEALQHAHHKGLVHRDIKPNNILLDASGIVYVADFGLALKEEDFGKGAGFAGTPAYMSPEQARGEGHRVDGRSDIFSLGVVFYELLVGRRPFKADSQQELLELITTVEARPPRQGDDTIPKELERICLKALAKRASERYTTAKDMADDLRHFLGSASAEEKPMLAKQGTDEAQVATPIPGSMSTPGSGQTIIKIVPKGLRSFDAHDADFFLELLPGPRDREGLPDSIRFWKNRIEATNADNTLSVGLIYGPSGCGKSSLVKAGLLPRLSENVLAVYVEATADETESRLLKGLRKQCPDLPATLGLAETLAALRRGNYLPAGRIAILILDQFEQWLHAKRSAKNTELVQALRQCDGGRVQCIVMVRDDFWMAATRFMRELEIRLDEGHNSAVVDLFDFDHATKVLEAFGHAFGKLPENPRDARDDQRQFLGQAIHGLAQDGKVVCVRLALFAEMMKGKPWTPATLKEVGGTEGIGLTFLVDTFEGHTALPHHRFHRKAAQAILKSLLPESGTDIKGQMRSNSELLAASGYTKRLKDFDDLIRILDSELRLIAPTDPEGADTKFEQQGAPGDQYYQLTHDYLVSSLREWLARRQRETQRGRAELRLAICSSVWNGKPENKYLPAWWEFLSIRLLTRKRDWTSWERKMMRNATRYHAVRGVGAAVLLIAATITGLLIRDQAVDERKATHAADLAQRLLDAETAQVPEIIDRLKEYRLWSNPLLKEEYDKEPQGSRRKLYAGLALMRTDKQYLEFVFSRFLEASPQEIWHLHKELMPYLGELQERLYGIVENPQEGHDEQGLSAACLLACFRSGKDANWPNISKTVVDKVLDSIQKNPSNYPIFLEMFQPVSDHLLAPLSAVIRSHDRSDLKQSFATNLLAEYAKDRPEMLSDLLLDSDETEFGVFFPKIVGQVEKPISLFQETVRTSLDSQKTWDDKERLARRQANAGVALVRLGKADLVWDLLKQSTDPRVRSYLIHRFRRLGADAGAIVKRLDQETDVTIRRALILSLGEYGEKDLSADARKALLVKLQGIYGMEADPGLHAATEWLLRTWKQEAWLRKINGEWTKGKEQSERKIKLAKEKTKTPPQWYVNSQGQTMVVIPAMETFFLMGSPVTEKGRLEYERQHKKKISRTFAIAAKSVTVEHFREFQKGYQPPENYSCIADLPAVGINWFEAAAYCNWLSEQDGIDTTQWCYETEPAGKTGPNSKVVKLKANYLRLEGYRLPTETEMEYATRAGAVTSRYFGETEELIPKYAWYSKNSKGQTWPVGSLKPNDLGFFDTQGNVYTWCQERYKEYPTGKGDDVIEDNEDDELAISGASRVLRGGWFAYPASLVRCAFRNDGAPTIRYNYVGFRVARTLTP